MIGPRYKSIFLPAVPNLTTRPSSRTSDIARPHFAHHWPAHSPALAQHQQAINLILPASGHGDSITEHSGLTRTNWPMSTNLLLYKIITLSLSPGQSSQFIEWPLPAIMPVFWQFFRSLRLWDHSSVSPSPRPTCLTLLRATCHHVSSETKDNPEQNDVKSERQYLYLADCWMVAAHHNCQSLGWIHYETQTSR
jgi:hypothetical protein